jgi:hypothetical protein
MTNYGLSPKQSREAFQEVRAKLAADPNTTGSVLDWVESVVLPMLQAFGARINVSALADIILKAMTASGGKLAILSAMISSLEQILSGGTKAMATNPATPATPAINTANDPITANQPTPTNLPETANSSTPEVTSAGQMAHSQPKEYSQVLAERVDQGSQPYQTSSGSHENTGDVVPHAARLFLESERIRLEKSESNSEGNALDELDPDRKSNPAPSPGPQNQAQQPQPSAPKNPKPPDQPNPPASSPRTDQPSRPVQPAQPVQPVKLPQNQPGQPANQPGQPGSQTPQTAPSHMPNQPQAQPSAPSQIKEVHPDRSSQDKPR